MAGINPNLPIQPTLFSAAAAAGGGGALAAAGGGASLSVAAAASQAQMMLGAFQPLGNNWAALAGGSTAQLLGLGTQLSGQFDSLGVASLGSGSNLDSLQAPLRGMFGGFGQTIGMGSMDYLQLGSPTRQQWSSMFVDFEPYIKMLVSGQAGGAAAAAGAQAKAAEAKA